ncbi:MAG: tetratricopeptide repeat protein [Rhodospirillales bacterium]|nr:tetratricopeptide repeat protein [Rhodospirillales bacterium]
MNDPTTSLTDMLKLGQAALQRGDHAAARTCFARIMEQNPDSVPAAIGLGLAKAISGDHHDGIATLQDLDRRYPGQGSIMDALGVANATAARFKEAETWFRKSIRVGGFRPATACNLGMALNELGRFDEGVALFKRCLRREPDNVSARYHLGLCQLMAGDYREGWQGFNLRNRVAGRADPTIKGIPCWTGEPLAGRKIVLLAEQGLGDTIQFARFALPLAEEGADVHIRCQDNLRDLLANVPGIAADSGPDDPVPDADYQVPLLSLPGLLGTTPETIPAAEGYLMSDPALVRKWREKLGASSHQRCIGLVWAGNPDNNTDYKRSIPLERLVPMLELPGCRFFSLQINPAAQELDRLDTSLRPMPLFDETLAFSEVAAAVSALDLLITVDTSLAHLAGALGRPVWTMISFVPDWRWQLKRSQTPWYDSMRLFRQPEIGDWTGTVEAVCDALAGTA